MDGAESLESLRGRAEAAFADRFGRGAEIIAAAPGRVNLIGEHIDYNDGFVLPMAIDRYTVVAAAPNGSSLVTIAALDLDETLVVDLTVPPEPNPGTWAGYVNGVVAGLLSKGASIPGLDAVTLSTVWTGGGLSSSAALTVSLATALEALTGHALDPKEKALLCKTAENDYVGVPCGIMDPLTSVMAQADHALLIDCMTQEVTSVPFASDEIAILITNSGVRHDLAEDAYAHRQAECRSALGKLGLASWRGATYELIEGSNTLTGAEMRRARHVVSETQRTQEAVRAIGLNNWVEFGELMSESHRSLRDDFEVSCDELDLLVDSLDSCEGVYGARMTGGGFGGCTVALVDPGASESVVNRVQALYREVTGIEADSFVTRPADGARLLRPRR